MFPPASPYSCARLTLPYTPSIDDYFSLSAPWLHCLHCTHSQALPSRDNRSAMFSFQWTPGQHVSFKSCLCFFLPPCPQPQQYGIGISAKSQPTPQPWSRFAPGLSLYPNQGSMGGPPLPATPASVPPPQAPHFQFPFPLPPTGLQMVLTLPLLQIPAL